MEKIYISDSGPEISAAIYGFWRWNTKPETSIKKIEDIINFNLELGINTFDHSDNYVDGKIEELFGKAIKAKSFKRDEIVISTKAGIITSKSAPFKRIDLSPNYLKKAVDASLKRLNTDYLDIFLLEEFDPLINAEETTSALTELVLSGKIKHIGVSNFNVFQHQLLASRLSKPLITNHIELSVLNTTAINDGRLDFIKEQYSKPMAWAPLAGGRVLNGKDKKAIKVRKTLKEVGNKYDANVEQTAVAWLYQLGALPIIGSTDKNRIKNAASAYNINLTPEDWYLIYNSTK
ncbi:MAG: aldo/keto reductase [Bacteroidetes bacterium]|nr:aldo/keto reductase [Bacteroidota bacterium]MCA6444020.1 aldo/keto reductase [Bacteroidota bacterium]